MKIKNHERLFLYCQSIDKLILSYFLYIGHKYSTEIYRCELSEYTVLHLLTY